MKKISLNDIDFSAIDSATLKKHGFDPKTIDTSSEKFKMGYMIGLVNLVARKDADFAAALNSAETIEAKYEVISKILDIPFETFIKAMEAITEEMQSMMYKNEATGELSDEALDMVAGGSKSGWNEFWDDTAGAVCTIVGSVATVAGVAVSVATCGLATPIGLLVAAAGTGVLAAGINSETS